MAGFFFFMVCSVLDVVPCHHHTDWANWRMWLHIASLVAFVPLAASLSVAGVAQFFLITSNQTVRSVLRTQSATAGAGQPPIDKSFLSTTCASAACADLSACGVGITAVLCPPLRLRSTVEKEWADLLDLERVATASAGTVNIQVAIRPA